MQATPRRLPLMAHADFDPDIQILEDEFGTATDQMMAFVQAYISGTITAPVAEDAIEETGTDLKHAVAVWASTVIPQAYADGISEAIKLVDNDTVPPEDHATLSGLAVRRLSRRLSHAADGLVVDALDRLDEAVEAVLAPMVITGLE